MGTKLQLLFSDWEELFKATEAGALHLSSLPPISTHLHWRGSGTTGIYLYGVRMLRGGGLSLWL